jgi:hypothetical protein
MKSARYAPALLIALVGLAACDDSSTPSAPNFTKAINQQLSASPLCWGLQNNNIDTSKPIRVGLGLFIDRTPPILAVAQRAGILSFDVGWDGPAKVMTIVIKKPEAWDKKSGLCYGRKIVDKISNWTLPNNTVAQVNFHWKIEPMGWATPAVIKAIGDETEGDGVAILQLMNTGWE